MLILVFDKDKRKPTRLWPYNIPLGLCCLYQTVVFIMPLWEDTSSFHLQTWVFCSSWSWSALLENLAERDCERRILINSFLCQSSLFQAGSLVLLQRYYHRQMTTCIWFFWLRYTLFVVMLQALSATNSISFFINPCFLDLKQILHMLRNS